MVKYKKHLSKDSFVKEMYSKLHKACYQVAVAEVDGDPHNKTLFQSREQAIKKGEQILFNEMSKLISTSDELIDQGVEAIKKHLQLHSQLKKEKIISELSRGLEKLHTLRKDWEINQPEELSLLGEDDHSEGKIESLQRLLGFSDETLKTIYSFGNQEFKEKKFPQARGILYFLTLLNPFVAEFWVGLALVEEKERHFEQALKWLAMGSIMDPFHPLPRIHAVYNYLELHLPGDAAAELEVLKEIARSRGLDLKKEIHLLETLVSERKNK